MSNDPSMFEVPDHLETRWASPENWTGKGGKAP